MNECHYTSLALTELRDVNEDMFASLRDLNPLATLIFTY